MRARVRLEKPNEEARTLEVAGESIRLGRDSECEVAVDPVAFPTVSGVHARIEVGPQGFVLVHLSQSNKTLINDRPVDGSVPGPGRRSDSAGHHRPDGRDPGHLSRRSTPRRQVSADLVRPSRPMSGTWPCSAAPSKPSALRSVRVA